MRHTSTAWGTVTTTGTSWEAEILERIGDNLYLAEYNGVRCTAIFNIFVGRYFVDDVYGVQGTK